MTLKDQLTALGYDCLIWTMPHSDGESILQVTVLEAGPSQGATTYISPEASLPQALAQIANKKRQFEAAGKEL